MEVWQTATLEASLTYQWVLGPLQLWLRSVGDELHLAMERGNELAETHRVVPIEPWREAVDELEWTRWIVHHATQAQQTPQAGLTQQEQQARQERSASPGVEVRLQPVMPDRAVVARPESPLRLPVGAAALFYVSIPIWVRLISHGPSHGSSHDPRHGPTPVTLREIPTLVLSNIWFGDPMSGELCYSLQTTARRETEQTPTRPHRAVCPVSMRNESQEELDIQRIRVPMAHLTVFDAGSRLWTNQVDVTYRGPDAGSQIEFVPGPPSQAAEGAVVVGEPREMMRKRLWMRAFGALGSMF